MGIAEKPIEDYLIQKCKEKGILQWKMTSPGTNGVPDRILFYQGYTAFIECKAPGKKPRKNQILRINQLREQNIQAIFVDSKESIDSFIETLISLPTINPWNINERTKDAQSNRLLHATVHGL